MTSFFEAFAHQLHNHPIMIKDRVAISVDDIHAVCVNYLWDNREFVLVIIA